MEIQITNKEAGERIKGKGIITSIIGVPIMLWGLFMIGCKTYDAITGCCTDCHFSVTEIMLAVTSGYGLFAAKDSLITGMLGLILPKKK